MSDWKIQAILKKKDMPEEVLDAFNRIFDSWNNKKYGTKYVGWLLNNFDFEKEYPNALEFDKLVLDDWIVSKKVIDKDTSVVLIKII